jgi:uncharacterized protein YcbK (DUF882 family)
LNNHLFKKSKSEEALQIDSRRQFLKKLAYGSMLALSGCGSEKVGIRPMESYGFIDQSQTPAPWLDRHGHKKLAFEHTHTGEKLSLTYFERGYYIKDALHEIDYLLRDFRSNDVHPIDTALLNQLFNLRQTLGINKPFQVISGFRSPFTNSQLRKHSHGVAEHSYHMQGRAIDIRVEGVSSRTIRNAALAKAQGGVGYYPRSNFVHLDTGNLRAW